WQRWQGRAIIRMTASPARCVLDICQNHRHLPASIVLPGITSSKETMIMQAIRSILVVMDPEQPEGLALKRAKLIAGVTQSHLHLLVCDKKHDHSAYLNDLRTSLAQEGFSVSGQQAWHENLYQTIITAQQAE